MDDQKIPLPNQAGWNRMLLSRILGIDVARAAGRIGIRYKGNFVNPRSIQG